MAECRRGEPATEATQHLIANTTAGLQCLRCGYISVKAPKRPSCRL